MLLHHQKKGGVKVLIIKSKEKKPKLLALVVPSLYEEFFLSQALGYLGNSFNDVSSAHNIESWVKSAIEGDSFLYILHFSSAIISSKDKN